MIINDKCNHTINAYLTKHMVYCPGCNKRFHSGHHPNNMAGINFSHSNYLFLLDNNCSSEYFSGTESCKQVLIRRIESRIQKQPDIYCPQELMTILQSCTQSEDDIPETRVELGDPPWKESDRTWFIDNPGRAHRLRRRFPGEDGDPADWIVVRCQTPGARARTPVQHIESDRAALLSNNEDALHRIFDLFYDYHFRKISSEYRDLQTKVLLDSL